MAPVLDDCTATPLREPAVRGPLVGAHPRPGGRRGERGRGETPDEHAWAAVGRILRAGSIRTRDEQTEADHQPVGDEDVVRTLS